MNLRIRKAEKSDIESIASNVVKMAYDASKIELCSKTVLDGVTSLFEKPELGFYVVAELDDQIIGSLVVVFEWSDWRDGLRWWIHSVYVEPNYRGQGIYDRLYGYVKKQAVSSKEVIGLNLSVDKNNMRAQKAYERLGMHPTNQMIYTDDSVK